MDKSDQGVTKKCRLLAVTVWARCFITIRGCERRGNSPLPCVANSCENFPASLAKKFVPYTFPLNRLLGTDNITPFAYAVDSKSFHFVKKI